MKGYVVIVPIGKGVEYTGDSNPVEGFCLASEERAERTFNYLIKIGYCPVNLGYRTIDKTYRLIDDHSS